MATGPRGDDPDLRRQVVAMLVKKHGASQPKARPLLRTEKMADTNTYMPKLAGASKRS